MSEKPNSKSTTRREVLKKAAFVAPSIITLTAKPAFASAGSQDHESRDRDRDRDRDHHRDRHERKRRSRRGDD